MSRSLKKGPYIDDKLLKKLLRAKNNGIDVAIKTWNRSCQIPPDFVGRKFAIYNGKNFIEVFITEGMVGHRLGEFSPTRTFRGHGQVTKRILEKT
jgi:small subunit ribosomal protein S19